MRSGGDSADHVGLQQFALAVYAVDGVPASCLTLQNRLDLDVNLVLFAAYVGAVRAAGLDEASVAAARDRVREWHGEVVRPLRAVRQRLKTGPPPAPSPATVALRSKLQQLEIESELIELAVLDDLATGPAASGEPYERTEAAIVMIARDAAGRELDDAERAAVSLIATAAVRVGN